MKKYRYLHVLQGYYGSTFGWEDLTQSEDKQEIRDDLQAYIENEGECYRVIMRREPREVTP